MTRRDSIYIVLLATLLAAPPALAQYERPGSTAGQFLKIGVSARAAGLGEAYIASADGAEAAHYNAANLGYLHGTDVLLNHTRWFAGIDHNFLAAAHTFEGIGTVALAVTSLRTSTMEVRTPLQPAGTDETFYASNLRAGLSYARLLTDRVSFGITLNYLDFSLYSDYDRNAVAVDIATSYATTFRGFRFGMKIANLGSEVRFINESYPLPTLFSFGAAINAVDAGSHRVTMNASAMKPNDGQPLGGVGLEYGFNELLYLRAGYRINHGTARYTFGGGLDFALNPVDLRFNYGYSAFGLLGVAHRFALGLHF